MASYEPKTFQTLFFFLRFSGTIIRVRLLYWLIDLSYYLFKKVSNNTFSILAALSSVLLLETETGFWNFSSWCNLAPDDRWPIIVRVENSSPRRKTFVWDNWKCDQKKLWQAASKISCQAKILTRWTLQFLAEYV